MILWQGGLLKCCAAKERLVSRPLPFFFMGIHLWGHVVALTKPLQIPDGGVQELGVWTWSMMPVA